MTYTASSPLLITDPLRIDTQAFAAHVNRLGGDRATETREYIEAVVSGALRMGIDPVIVLAQWWLETDAGRSQWWVKGLNPAGLGITGDPAQNAKAQTWPNGTAAAYGHLAHLAAYIWGEDAGDHWPQSWPDLVVADRRFGVAVYAYGGEADTLRDLNGTWAIDPQNNYHGKLADRANAIVRDFGQGAEPMAITFGRVPVPVHEKRLVLNSRAWNDLGPRTIRGCVWHRMYGTLWGTDGYFRGAAVDRALTDIGIGVAATDGGANDGRCFMWNDPRGRRAPWANGPTQNTRDDGKLFVDRYGVNAVNRDLFSIEISGNGDTPLSPKARQMVVSWTAYWADQYRVSHETFPAIPGEGGRSFVIWHGEINGGKWGTCPGAVVESATNAMIAEVKALLKSYQEAASDVPTYAKPQPVESGTRIINDRLFVGVDKAYTIRRETVPRLWADPSSPATGPMLNVDAVVMVTHMVEDVGEASGLTLVLQDGSRIPALSLVSA